MYLYDLIDGVLVKGELVKTVSIEPLTDANRNTVADLVDVQHEHLVNMPDFKPVNDKHTQAIKGLMLLNENAAASISYLGKHHVIFTYGDICDYKITAQDWNVILTASMAVSELHSGNDGEMLA
ncbi:6-phospho-beta-glucosidase [Vibrio tasmaniensis]|uniref:6-phospho-beta-glucosidase n=1 Tax=Vibrio tasmaniensis TaxID=212663 RepID=UPI00107F5082|nr:6-phospho-beta-glucosidase [Vibrio tasmaniensis]